MTILLLIILTTIANARDSIVALKSDSLAEYDGPIKSFSELIGIEVEVFDIEGDRKKADSIVKALVADPPLLVFALGAKAAYVAVHELSPTPVIYVMVHNPSRYGIFGTNVTGVSMDLPPDMVLSQFRLLAPKVEQVGILVSNTQPTAVVGRAIAAAKDVGLTATARRVGSQKQLRYETRKLLKEVDAIWLLPDPELVTPSNFHFIRREATNARAPMLVYSEPLVKAGALMCVAPNYEVVGRQAAELAPEILSGRTAGAIKVATPESPRVVLNGDTQEAIGLEIDEVMLDFVDEIISTPVWE